MRPVVDLPKVLAYCPSGYKLTNTQQLLMWLGGASLHRDVPRVTGGECCPDFSCCYPDMEVTREEREAFIRADERGRLRFLGVFLGRMIEVHGKKGRKVYVSTGQEEKEN